MGMNQVRIDKTDNDVSRLFLSRQRMSKPLFDVLGEPESSGNSKHNCADRNDCQQGGIGQSRCIIARSLGKEEGNG